MKSREMHAEPSLEDLGQGIQVMIGLESDEGGLMGFLLLDDRVRAYGSPTPNDLKTAIAVLRDLADGLEKQLQFFSN